MDDPVQHPSRVVVVEDERGERRPIELTRFVQDAAAKARNYLCQARRARFHHLAREHVGIDDVDTASSEEATDDRLPRGDAAGETDELHGAIASARSGVLLQRRRRR